MDISALKGILPEEARDLRVNLERVLAPASLTQTQGQAVARGSAKFLRHEALWGWAQEHSSELTAGQVKAVDTVTSLMAMTTIYYRSTHLLARPELTNAPAELRMQGFRPSPDGLSAADQELVALGCAALAGCAQLPAISCSILGATRGGYGRHPGRDQDRGRAACRGRDRRQKIVSGCGGIWKLWP
jgi:alkyl hydroperoxide reductase subunit D